MACQANPVYGRRIACIYPSSQSKGSSFNNRARVWEVGQSYVEASHMRGSQTHPLLPHMASLLCLPHGQYWAYLDVFKLWEGVRAGDSALPRTVAGNLPMVEKQGGGESHRPDLPMNFWGLKGCILAWRRVVLVGDDNMGAAFGQPGGPVARPSPYAEVILSDPGVT
ncbi:hypothetical protein CGRA01v4_12672 [Colletotrichum graminicola]|nr:hypothetical protein CGRA01v4_12672 [Colletotrichum graminicola]